MRLRHGLEDEECWLRAWITLHDELLLLFGGGRGAHDRPHVRRGRSVLHKKIHDGRHAHCLGSGGAEEREYLSSPKRGAQAEFDLLVRQRPFLNKFIQKCLLALGNLFDELLVHLFRLCLVFCGNFKFAILAFAVTPVLQHLHTQNVDDRFELQPLVDRELDRYEVVRKPALCSGEDALEVRVLVVELIDDKNNAVPEFPRVLPDDLRSDLCAFDRLEKN